MDIKVIKMIKMAVAGVALSVSGLANAAIIDIDFTNNDGGFASSGSPDWIYTGSAWDTAGGESTDNALTSSLFTVQADGDVIINLEHLYNFERPDDFYDGGILEASINGNSYSVFTPAGGYPVATGFQDGCDGMGFNPCWSGDSEGVRFDTVTLPSLLAGDAFNFRFSAYWDGSIYTETTNWRINAVSVSNVVDVDAPSSLAIFALSIMGLASRRFKKRS